MSKNQVISFLRACSEYGLGFDEAIELLYLSMPENTPCKCTVKGSDVEKTMSQLSEEFKPGGGTFGGGGASGTW